MDNQNPYAPNGLQNGPPQNDGSQYGQPPSGQPYPPVDPNAGANNGGPVPAAYDTQGRPLYYAPPPGMPTYATQTAAGMAVQHTASSNGGNSQPSDDDLQRCEQSRKQYPKLNLSDGEYIVSEVKRHPFGLFQIWLIAFTLIGAFGALLFGYISTQSNTAAGFSNVVPIAMVGLVLIGILVVIGAIVASYVYNSNKFYVTNESVIQEIQESLFGKHEQTVSLGRIEDASYFQNGILPNMFNYGRIRLSTVGDESTYQFNYVNDPKKVIAQLNNEIERFKGLHH